MKVQDRIHSDEQKVPARRVVARAAALTGAAAIVFLAMWSSTSAGVVQGEHDVPAMVVAAGSVAGSGEHDVLSKDADQRARADGQWLRAAHGRVAATSREQALPSQF